VRLNRKYIDKKNRKGHALNAKRECTSKNQGKLKIFFFLGGGGEYRGPKY
jgi:hypothetical protein